MERPELIARRCFVSGRVQRVFFRGATREQAIALGCSGYARNLADGRVEVLIVGSREAADALTRWLWRGPPSAHVSDVTTEDVPLAQVIPLPAQFTTS